MIARHALGFATTALLLSLARCPAMAQSDSPGTLAVLDARHVVMLRGDRMVVYEIDPARGHAVRVLNTVILDEEGQILGQFRPDKPAVGTPPSVKPGAAPKVKPKAAPAVEERRSYARREPNPPAPFPAREGGAGAARSRRLPPFPVSAANESGKGGQGG